MRITCHSAATHSNIISIYALKVDTMELVMELAHFGTLKDVVSQSGPLDINKWRVKLCFDIANAMSYLHSFSPQILHRDLKASNVLVCMGNKEEPIAKVTKMFWSSHVRLETLDYLSSVPILIKDLTSPTTCTHDLQKC